MSVFLEIRNVVAKEIDLDKCCRKLDHKYFLSAMYFSQLVYFKWSFVEKSVTSLPRYHSHEIYDIDGVQALLVEFQNSVWVTFRGTEMKFNDWITILRFWQGGYGMSEAHEGFVKAWDKIKEPLLARIMEARVRGKEAHFTGHSMGGALATLASIDHKPAASVVFGSPRVLQGKYYADYFKSFPFIRFEMDWDIVTHIPFSMSFITNYNHVGLDKRIPGKFKLLKNHFIKSYLRESLNLYYAESTGLGTTFARITSKELKEQ